MDTIEIKVTPHSYININQDDREITIKGDAAFEYLTEMVIDTVAMGIEKTAKRFDYNDFMQGLAMALEITKCNDCDDWVKMPKNPDATPRCSECYERL